MSEVCWQLMRLPVDKDRLNQVCDEWAKLGEPVYGLIVPTIAKWPCREVVHGTNLWFDCLDWWTDSYLILNETAFKQLAPFTKKQFESFRPVIFW